MKKEVIIGIAAMLVITCVASGCIEKTFTVGIIEQTGTLKQIFISELGWLDNGDTQWMDIHLTEGGGDIIFSAYRYYNLKSSNPDWAEYLLRFEGERITITYNQENTNRESDIARIVGVRRAKEDPPATEEGFKPTSNSSQNGTQQFIFIRSRGMDNIMINGGYSNKFGGFSGDIITISPRQGSKVLPPKGFLVMAKSLEGQNSKSLIYSRFNQAKSEIVIHDFIGKGYIINIDGPLRCFSRAFLIGKGIVSNS